MRYMQIIIQIRRQNTIDMMHIWIRIGLFHHFDIWKPGYLFDFDSTYAIGTSILCGFWGSFEWNNYPPKSSCNDSSIKNAKFSSASFGFIQKVSREMPTYVIANAKIETWIFHLTIRGNCINFDIILNNFSSFASWASQN